MYRDKITLYNYHTGTAMWYPSVIEGVDLGSVRAATATASADVTNADTVEVLIPCGRDKTVCTAAGTKRYAGPKEYAACETPAQSVTFRPECDFFLEGEPEDLTPVSDEDYESGFYHAMNEERDGVYMITSASFYGLLPHFEIGGR